MKGLLEDRFDLLGALALGPAALEQESAVGVRNRQRIAVFAANAELALEVGAPHHVGLGGGRQRVARSGSPIPTTPLLHQAMPLEHGAYRAVARPRDVGLVAAEVRQELLGSPRRVLLAQLHDRLTRGFIHRVRTSLRSSGQIRQPRQAALEEPLDPLVARLACDSELTAKLGHRLVATQVRQDEVSSLFHGS